MFSDKIEIKSPGDLPRGISAEEYMNGDITCDNRSVSCNE
ncbi:MAG: hypothetical protein MRZ63_00705 [Anaerostipes sp.]|nr:hypothetical protein [Anaerostipes sp.]